MLAIPDGYKFTRSDIFTEANDLVFRLGWDGYTSEGRSALGSYEDMEKQGKGPVLISARNKVGSVRERREVIKEPQKGEQR